MSRALIGYTGFVGGNLAAQYKFDGLYNSKNIQDIKDKPYDLIVSAGARAEKWRINQEPAKDLAEINLLIDNLKKTKAKKFVLISTIDVYKNPDKVDEDTRLETDGLHAYGANRIYLENFIRHNFEHLIVRLPGLFGKGLKKNTIYDFLHNNNLNRIHWAGSFQYYNLDHIWNDIQIALKYNLKLINFATEPIRTDDLAAYCFGIKNFKNYPKGVVPSTYDMHTKYAKLYGKKGKYLYSKAQVLDEIKLFVRESRSDT